MHPGRLTIFALPANSRILVWLSCLRLSGKTRYWQFCVPFNGCPAAKKICSISRSSNWNLLQGILEKSVVSPKVFCLLSEGKRKSWNTHCQWLFSLSSKMVLGVKSLNWNQNTDEDLWYVVEEGWSWKSSDEIWEAYTSNIHLSIPLGPVLNRFQNTWEWKLKSILHLKFIVSEEESNTSLKIPEGRSLRLIASKVIRQIILSLFFSFFLEVWYYFNFCKLYH